MTLPRRPWTVQDALVCTLSSIPYGISSTCDWHGSCGFESVLVPSNPTRQICPVFSSWQTDPLLPTFTVSVSLPVTPWARAGCIGEAGSPSAPSQCPGTGQEMFVLNV